MGSKMFEKMNFLLTFVMLVLVVVANATPEPKTFLVETADEIPYRRQGEYDDGNGSGSGDDYWNQFMQNININNGGCGCGDDYNWNQMMQNININNGCGK